MARRHENVSADQLDDEADRDELRQRYYGLMQELRVLLPGVQILVAFMLTVPFANGFSKLDETGRALYGIALTTGLLAIIAFTTPTVLHRLGDREARSQRLAQSIRLARVGLLFLAVSLLAALTVVARVVFSSWVALVCVLVVALAMVLMWIVLPLALTRDHKPPP